MTIRDGVMLLLVLVKKSAAKTHIYYSIYIVVVLFTRSFRDECEGERRVFVLFCSFSFSLFFSTFFSNARK